MIRLCGELLMNTFMEEEEEDATSETAMDWCRSPTNQLSAFNNPHLRLA